MRSSRVVHAIDTHTEGMPTRVVTGGVPPVPGATMAERRSWAKENLEDLRGLLMREPHGHAAMSGAILQPPTSPDGHWGVLYIETTGFLPMCGHGTIGVATALVETGLVPVTEPVTEIRLDTPAGRVIASVDVEDGRARSVSLTNVPAFVLEDEAVVDVEGLGEVRYAMVYGGNFYPVVDAAALGVELDLVRKDQILALGLRIIDAVNEQRPPVHPGDPAIRGIHHAQFVQPGTGGADTRNAVLNVPGYFDRSPCGTGTSAIMALRCHRGELSVGGRHVNESMLGTRFTGEVLTMTDVAGRPAIVPRITGRAWVTGFSQHLLDPADPFPAGFTV
ncbi:proline racemase family protein [Kineosporia sp. R_H_3]|uniref:proline racemase family protein n=1 Tax=Kineosporia sp. R_H_3 TaxID=1961848 RepID=UPI000B4AEAD2|nr:proline racemase family protein [Kineosporia sp. R_H_3]